MARKRDVIARVGADTSEFDSKLEASGGALDKFAKLGKTAGTVVATALVAAAGAVVTLTSRGLELGDAADKAAEALGVTVSALAGLRHAGSLAGAEAQAIDTALAKLARTTSEAASGTKEYADTFAALNLNAKELRELPLDEQMLRVSDALAAVENATDRARLAQDLFGRSGAKLLPLLNQGSAAIREQMEEAKRLGLTLDEVQRRSIVDANDAIDRMKSSVDGLSQQLAAAFGPAIKIAADAVTDLVATVTSALPRLQALAERFLGLTTAAENLGDVALKETLVEQIRALDELSNRLAEERKLRQYFAEGGGDYVASRERENAILAEQAEKQARINELLAERVRRSRALEEPAAAPPVDEDRFGSGDEEAKKAAAAELALVTSVYEEQERLRQLELEQEAEWRQALFEAREEFNAAELEQERALVDALLIEQQRYHEELAARDEAELMRKKRIRKDTVDNAFAGFTAITAALSAHNEKAFKLNKIAAKAEASLNAYRAIQQVWADESLPFYAKIAATALTAASTAANIAAINKTEFGGGAIPSNLGATPVVPGGAGLGDSAPGRGNRSQTIFVEGLTPESIFSGSAVRGLLERIQAALDDGGKLVLQ